MYWRDRLTYVCLQDRFTSKYPGQCPHCRGTMTGLYDLDTPRKRDDRGWKKLELMIQVMSSGIQLCSWSCCVPIRGCKNSLTLSEYRANIRKRLTHRQGEVPQYYKYR